MYSKSKELKKLHECMGRIVKLRPSNPLGGERKGSGLIELEIYWTPCSYTLCIVSAESQHRTHLGWAALQEGVSKEEKKSYT